MAKCGIKQLNLLIKINLNDMDKFEKNNFLGKTVRAQAIIILIFIIIIILILLLK